MKSLKHNRGCYYNFRLTVQVPVCAYKTLSTSYTSGPTKTSGAANEIQNVQFENYSSHSPTITQNP